MPPDAPGRRYSFGVMLVILAALGFVSTVIPLYALSAAIVRIGSARASVLGMVGPIIAVGLCVLLLGERLNPVQWAGAATVMGGVALAGRRKPAVGEK